MTRTTTHTLLPSNARVRRHAHLKRAEQLRARKRTRRHRAEIHAAIEAAKRLVAVTGAGPFTVGKKLEGDHLGGPWPILDASGTVVGTGSTRTRAREVVKARNESDGLTKAEAMNRLGWTQIGNSGPVEKRYRKI
jgi:hypothetical protein